MIFVPDYYKDFKCIANKCTDSCCVGWEIDVDSASLEKYKRDGSPIATELLSHIETDADIPYIRLACDGRCPFLDETGLCRVISAEGEGYIPDICKNHPRYYNEIGEDAECSIGLACPEAARIILSLTKKPKIECDPTKLEKALENREITPTIADKVTRELYEMRDRLFSFVFDKSIGIVGVLSGLLDCQVGVTDYLFGGEMPRDISYGTPERLCAMLASVPRVFSSLELLDESLRSRGDVNTDGSLALIESRGDSLRPLLYYFLHRYFLAGAEDGDLDDRLSLAVILTLTYLLISEGMGDIEGAVCFSKNIEYSTENIEILLSIIAEIE